MTAVTPARYSYGADEHIFVELSAEMSLDANFRMIEITTLLSQQKLDGLVDICPANASYLVRYDPDRIAPSELMRHLQELEKQVGAGGTITLNTRVVEIPVLFRDPWTTETLKKFRDRHQDPEATDVEYAARINGFDDAAGFIDAYAGSPWFTSMVGFVAGLPFLFQMVERDKQLVVPKYLRPRTETPKQTIGHGGCFACIYSVKGAGGYQMFGITPAPIYDPDQKGGDFVDQVVFFRPGDVVKFGPIDRAAYDDIAARAKAGTYRLRQRPIQLSLPELQRDLRAVGRKVVEVLYED
jgi:urea carboxylase